ncbi:MAG: tetratricopeptide repeat protein [Leptospirales bacterium]
MLERILGIKQIIKDGLGGPVELHELGICYFSLRNFRQSSKYLNELIESYGDYVEIAAVMALQVLCLIEDEEYSAAEEILADRLSKFSSDLRLLSMQAHVFEKTGRYRESIDCHRRILQLDPDNVNSLNSVGYLLSLHGKTEAERNEAYAALKRVIQKKPDHPAYLDSFGVFLARQGDRPRARKALLKALQRAPENQDILNHIQEFLD